MPWAFVDYENVGSLEDIALEKYERLYVFCGPKNSRLKLGDIPADGFCRIELIGLKSSGRNNLDFHLSFYLGRSHEVAEKDVGFVVISNDAGFEGVIHHLRKLGRDCHLVGTRKPKAKAEEKAPKAKAVKQPKVKAAAKPKATNKASLAPAAKLHEAPAPKAEAGSALDKTLQHLIAQLKHIGEQKRPTKKAKLVNWLKSHLPGTDKTADPEAILHALERHKQLQVSGNNVTYLF